MQTRIIKYTYGKPRSSRNELTLFSHKLGLRVTDTQISGSGFHHVNGFGFSCSHAKLLGWDSDCTAHLSVSLGFAIIV